MVTSAHCIHLGGCGSLRTETPGVGPALSPDCLHGPAFAYAYPHCQSTQNTCNLVANRPDAAKEAVKGPHGRPD
jgi:hypothetical protein